MAEKSKIQRINLNRILAETKEKQKNARPIVPEPIIVGVKSAILSGKTN